LFRNNCYTFVDFLFEKFAQDYDGECHRENIRQISAVLAIGVGIGEGIFYLLGELAKPD